jgi:outer membrane protein OmpA-like peptidoglycan-associated protein
MSNDASDRDAIVARRALFVSSTLAALGCSSPDTNVTDASVDTVTVPTPGTGTATAPPTSTATTAPAGNRTPWSMVVADSPSFDVPPAGSGVTDAERKQLEDQAKAFRERYAQLGAAWDKGPPGCAPDACEPDWKAAAKEVGSILEGLRGPLCGWGDQQSISIIERQQAHHAFLHQKAGLLEADIAAAADRAGQKASWEKIRGSSVIPHPCLSCMQPQPRVFEQVPFGEDDAIVSSDGQAALERVKQVLGADPKMRLQIRGHADQAEKTDKKALAKKRAEAVRDWLTKAGIAGNRLEVVVLADAVPIMSPKGADRGQNRRVDFERAK